MKKFLSILLALTLCVSLLPMAVLADDEPETEAAEVIEPADGETPAVEPADEPAEEPAEEGSPEAPAADGETTNADADAPETEDPLVEEPEEPAEEAEETAPEAAQTAGEEAADAAENEEPIASGTCGENLTWTLDSDGVLTISGEGEMENYWGTCPWHDQSESITSAVIEQGVTSIGDNALNGCTNLTSVIIPDSVTHIGESAFSNCTGLTEVTIGSGVVRMDWYVFSGCTSLTSVTISNGVTSIGNWAFFDCTGLTEITIPDSVTTIGSEAFSGCIKLKNISFPDSVTEIANDAFAGTPWLADQGKFVIVNHVLVEYLGEDSDVEIPDGVTRIGGNAFSGCKSLTSVTIPDSVTYIEDGAFSGCSNLTDVTLPDTVMIYDIMVFLGTPWLKAQEETQGDFLILGASLLAYRGEGGAVEIPAGQVKHIPDMFFGYDESITSVVIPEGVTHIGYRAFMNCTNLTSVTIPDSVTYLGWEAFVDCTSLVSVTLPRGLTKIPDGIFNGCTSLREITIPGSTTEVGMSAFADCASLTELSLPDGLSSIDGGAFDGCTSVKKVKIPASVTDIAYRAFADCTSLATIAFDGDAPAVYTPASLESYYGSGTDTSPLAGVTAKASYYTDTNGWTEEAQASFGGNITWQSLGIRYLTSADKTVTAEYADGSPWSDGTTLAVTPKTGDTITDAVKKANGIDKYTAYDIALMKDGKPIQPNGNVIVTVPVPEGYDGTKCVVFRMEENGTLTDMKAALDGDMLRFVTDHFSTYIVAEAEVPAVLKGDVNGDGKVNAKDVTVLFQYVNKQTDAMPNPGVGDVNGDSKTDAKDVTRLFQYANRQIDSLEK